MSTYAQIADGLVTRLVTISGLRAVDHPTPNPEPPVAVVVPGPNLFDQTYRNGLTESNWTVRVLVARGDERSAAERLYGYLDPSGSSSVKAAIEGDPTLGGIVDTLHVTGFDEPSVFTYGAGQLLGVDFNIVVHH